MNSVNEPVILSTTTIQRSGDAKKKKKNTSKHRKIVTECIPQRWLSTY